MAVLKGATLAWGSGVSDLDGFTAAVSGGYTTTAADYSRAANLSEITDGEGDVISVYVYGGSETCSIKAYFSGSSANVGSIPACGEVCTITASDSNLNGDWLVESVSKARSNESHCTFDLSMKRWDGITL